MQSSVAAWSALGFTIESTSSQISRLTDGQLLLALVEQEFPSPGLAYFHADSFEAADSTIEAPGNLIIFRHPSPLESARKPSKEQNALLGYFDALVVPTEDVKGARQWAEENGFFVVEEWGNPQPQSDVTDGLITLSFRQGYASKMIGYLTDIDEDLVQEITDAMREATASSDAVAVRRSTNGDVELIRVLMPEGTIVVVVPDL